jgi:tetratricopeptide (TPR) repeat protein
MSPRSHVVAIVSLVAVGAAGLAVGGALLQGGRVSGDAHGQTEGATNRRETAPPALELAVLSRDDPEARALRAGERLYESGKTEQARRRFQALLAADPRSVEAAVGAAIAAWPDGTVERLRAIVARNPESAVARLNLGLALVAGGDLVGARREWRVAERAEPDSPAALKAEDLANPETPPGRPRFILADRLPSRLARLPAGKQVRALRRLAEVGGGAEAWLVYASALEQVGRRLSARRAYDRAAELAPASVEALTAAAVARFDKDDPAKAFARLGPLAARHPRAAVVRLHLALLLLWLPNLEEAREQLTLAAKAEPGSYYAREARRILASLAGVE